MHTFFMYDVGNGDIKLGIKCTTVLSAKRYLATDCTDVFPHYMESLICMNIWNETKTLFSLLDMKILKVLWLVLCKIWN